jgi:single-strand DNA-binding protein
MSGLNKVFLLGNIGQDPDFRFTTGGAALLKLRLATNESYVDKNKQRQERTEWHSVLIWGARGEALSKFLKKGERVFVEGSLRTSSYEVDGIKKYKTEIHASDIILAGSAKGTGAKGDAPKSKPRSMTSAGVATSPEPEPMEDFGNFAPSEDDEIPF